jgi:hypothetical protein
MVFIHLRECDHLKQTRVQRRQALIDWQAQYGTGGTLANARAGSKVAAEVALVSAEP